MQPNEPRPIAETEEAARRLAEAVQAGDSPEEVLPTLDEASRELATKLGKDYEERQAVQQRLQQGVTARGRFRKNAPCPCGSGIKFKKCCRRDFLEKTFLRHPMNIRPVSNESLNPLNDEPKELPTDEN